MDIKPQTSLIKTIFLISFISIIIFCILLVSGIYLYKFVSKKIIETRSEKNYNECLIEQKEADKVALSYVPILSRVEIDSNANVNIEGKIAGFKDIAKLGIEFDTPNKECMNSVVNYNQENGSFVIKSGFLPKYQNLQTRNNEVCWTNGRVDIKLLLEPYDRNKIIVSVPNEGCKQCSINFNDIFIRKETNSEKWCLGGRIDIGLGSAPTWDLTETELLQIGLTKDRICTIGLRSTPVRAGADEFERINKCKGELLNIGKNYVPLHPIE